MHSLISSKIVSIKKEKNSSSAFGKLLWSTHIHICTSWSTQGAITLRETWETTKNHSLGKPANKINVSSRLGLQELKIYFFFILYITTIRWDVLHRADESQREISTFITRALITYARDLTQEALAINSHDFSFCRSAKPKFICSYIF